MSVCVEAATAVTPGHQRVHGAMGRASAGPADSNFAQAEGIGEKLKEIKASRPPARRPPASASVTVRSSGWPGWSTCAGCASARPPLPVRTAPGGDAAPGSGRLSRPSPEQAEGRRRRGVTCRSFWPPRASTSNVTRHLRPLAGDLPIRGDRVRRSRCAHRRWPGQGGAYLLARWSRPGSVDVVDAQQGRPKPGRRSRPRVATTAGARLRTRVSTAPDCRRHTPSPPRPAGPARHSPARRSLIRRCPVRRSPTRDSPTGAPGTRGPPARSWPARPRSPAPGRVAPTPGLRAPHASLGPGRVPAGSSWCPRGVGVDRRAGDR